MALRKRQKHLDMSQIGMSTKHNGAGGGLAALETGVFWLVDKTQAGGID